MRHSYLVYGVLVVGWMAWASYYGSSWTDVDEVKSVPKSVRDNPGAYRSHYRSQSRYYGGK